MAPDNVQCVMYLLSLLATELDMGIYFSVSFPALTAFSRICSLPAARIITYVCKHLSDLLLGFIPFIERIDSFSRIRFGIAFLHKRAQ